MRLFSYAFLVTCLLSMESSAQEKFIITGHEISSAPISPLLVGNFIELGYGIQVESMWSEMFFNRSFEPFKAYKTINKLWFDLYYDEKDLSKGYEKDWSKFDWYHSGYEHNAWFAAPGDPGRSSLIADEMSFFITATTERKAEIMTDTSGSGHGKQCLQLVNREEDQWAAVAQQGKLLQKGKTYQFRGMVKADYGTAHAEVRFYPQGNWTDPISVIPVNNLGVDYREISFTFLNGEFEGYATFSLWIPPGSAIHMDDFSLKPASNYYGWRPEVVDVFKQLNPRVVRFPGGCFASFYNWQDGIGPFSEREPGDSYFWGGQNYNDVGTAEFAMLCKAAGAEMSICANVYHPSKRKMEVDFPTWQAEHGYDFPEFMSLTEGAKATADWVAYCNLPAGSHPMADLRARHGYPEPFGVTYWELDNELHRWYEPEDYAHAAVVYSKAMKAVDPSIKIGLSSYGGRPGKPGYHYKIDEMLEIAGYYIDFLADRGDADKTSRYMLEKVKKFNREHGTNIKYCDTEWLAYNTDTNRDSYNMSERQGDITKSYMFSKWTYALNLLKNFMSFQRLDEGMLFVNFNNLANTHSQSAMETPKETAYLTASGRALQLLSNSPAAWVLKFEGYQARASDEFQVQAAWDIKRETLVLYVCNRTPAAKQVSFDLSALQRQFSRAEITLLTADGPLSMNAPENPDAISLSISTDEIKIRSKTYAVKSGAFSFTQVVLR
jgi:alpha-N-arabinofuranosidase